MYIIKALNKATGIYETFPLAGNFPTKERAKGAAAVISRLQDDLTLKVEFVDGRTVPTDLAKKRASMAHAREVKAAQVKAEQVKAAQVKKVDPRPEEISLSSAQVAALIGSIHPKAGSGEYVLDLSAIRRTA